jgi:hypothetical protein
MTDARTDPPLPATSNRDPDPRSEIRTTGANPLIDAIASSLPETSASFTCMVRRHGARRPAVASPDDRGIPMSVRLDVDGPPPGRAERALTAAGQRQKSLCRAPPRRVPGHPRAPRCASRGTRRAIDRPIDRYGWRSGRRSTRFASQGPMPRADSASGDPETRRARSFIDRPCGVGGGSLSESRTHRPRTARNTACLPSIAIPPSSLTPETPHPLSIEPHDGHGRNNPTRVTRDRFTLAAQCDKRRPHPRNCALELRCARCAASKRDRAALRERSRPPAGGRAVTVSADSSDDGCDDGGRSRELRCGHRSGQVVERLDRDVEHRLGDVVSRPASRGKD